MVGVPESRLSIMRRFLQRTDDALTPAELTSLWVAVTLGVPVVVVGYELMVSPSLGGLGMSATQLLLAVPLGVVIAVGLLWIAARPGAAYGEGMVVLLKPSFGAIGAWIYLPVHLTLMVVLAALELRVIGVALGVALEGIGVPFPTQAGIAVGAVVAVGLGLVGALRWWVRRIAFWAGLATAMWIVWRLAAGIDLAGFRLQEPSPWFWLGVDMIAGLAVLFFPLVVDTTRALPDENTAPAAVGAGFGVPALLVLMAGGLAAAATPGVVDPARVIADFGGPAVGVVGALVLLVWVVFAEGDQPALFLAMPTRALGSLGINPPGWVAAIGGPAIATAVALLVGTRDLFGIVSFLISVLTPMLGVFLADYYVVRRGAYLSRDLYRGRGVYRGVNLAAVLSMLVGFVVFQWASPVGATWWIDVIVPALPGAPLSRFGVPAVVVALVVAFTVYAAVGRFTVRDESYVAHMRSF
jgi:purine-cytosine permease-like protein